MPAVRFMRKSRAIESQHGADLSRVGRNDDGDEREKRGAGELLDGMDRKEERGQRNKTSIDRKRNRGIYGL